MVETDMGSDGAEEQGESVIVKGHADMEEVETGKMDGGMEKTETENTGENIGKMETEKMGEGEGKAEIENEVEEVGEAETETRGEDAGKVETDKMEDDVGKAEAEKTDESMVEVGTEKMGRDLGSKGTVTGKEETENTAGDMVKAGIEKTEGDMGKAEIEKTEDDIGRGDIEKTEEDTGKAEVMKEDKNMVKPMEEDNKEEDGQSVADHGVKEHIENKPKEPSDSEDSDKDDKKSNEEKEAEAQVRMERKRSRKRSNREQAKEDVVKSVEGDSTGDGGTAADHEMKEAEESKLEEHNDSEDSDKEDTINEEKEGDTTESVGRKRPRKHSNKGQSKEEANEPTSPFPIDRPVRERKSVERLVASIEKEPAREFLIPKGRGTALKDIPNVAQKLSRKKNEDTFKMLHVILFGRRGKATQVKSNVSQFSGFVWHENEEKQRLKMKEKLDKLVKEKLLEFCDVFDIPVLKTTAKKEDIIIKLLDFLAAPHPNGDVVLAEKEKSGSVKKRNRMVKDGVPDSGDSSAKHSSKKQRKNEGSPKLVEKESESDSEDGFDRSEPVHVFENEEDAEGSVPDGSDDEAPNHSESKEKGNGSREEAEIETRKQNLSSKKSAKMLSPTISKSKKIATGKKDTQVSSPKISHISKHSKDESEKGEDAARESNTFGGSKDEAGGHSESMPGKDSGKGASDGENRKQNQSSKKSSRKVSPVIGKPKKVTNTKKETPVKSPKISPSTIGSKVNDNGDRTAVVFSRKKKNQETSTKKSSAPLKSASKESDSKLESGEKRGLGKEEMMTESCAPSEQELRKVICEILSEVDLNKATFIDILKQLGQHFQMDLEPRKSVIKVMVKEELIKLNDEDDEDDDEDDEESDNEKEKPKPAVREVRKAKPPPVHSAASVDDEDRCRRSDGKKWRCSREVVPGHKYCDHHMHRGRKR